MELLVNGDTHTRDVEDEMPLLWALREELGGRDVRLWRGPGWRVHRAPRTAHRARGRAGAAVAHHAGGGVGEVAMPHLCAAVANAMAVLGERPRHLPLIG